MTTTSVPGMPAGSQGHDAEAWVARRRRLLEQVDDALRRVDAGHGEDGDWSMVATTLQRVRGELRRDVSVADVDAATEPGLRVVGRGAGGGPAASGGRPAGGTS